MIEIDKSIKLPPARMKYPWTAMGVGDSFFVPGKNTSSTRICNPPTLTEQGWKFAMRTVTEDGVKGVRVWRTA
jgi:hypothetical protein